MSVWDDSVLLEELHLPTTVIVTKVPPPTHPLKRIFPILFQPLVCTKAHFNCFVSNKQQLLYETYLLSLVLSTSPGSQGHDMLAETEDIKLT